MVIFHSFLYVYQRVTTICGKKSRPQWSAVNVEIPWLLPWVSHIGFKGSACPGSTGWLSCEWEIVKYPAFQGGSHHVSTRSSLDGYKLIPTSLLVWEYLRSPAKNLSFFAGYLRLAMSISQMSAKMCTFARYLEYTEIIINSLLFYHHFFYPQLNISIFCLFCWFLFFHRRSFAPSRES